MPRPKTLYINKLFSDEEISKREGTWFDEKDIKYPIINTNTDVYRVDEDGTKNLLLKFRKNCIPSHLIRLGWDSYKDLAKAARGRGASAGPIDTDSQYFGKRKLVGTKKWSTGYLKPKGTELHDLYSSLDITELLVTFKEELLPADVVLVKGSRSAHMERFVDAMR